ncbi:MAG: hypothetical protein ACYCX5_12545 [Coriobacteriia bacterium]
MAEESSFKTGEFLQKLSLGVLDGAAQVLSAKYQGPTQTTGTVTGPAGQAMPVSAGAGDNSRLMLIGGAALAVILLVVLVKK